MEVLGLVYFIGLICMFFGTAILYKKGKLKGLSGDVWFLIVGWPFLLPIMIALNLIEILMKFWKRLANYDKNHKEYLNGE
jgi:hypothetical protein